MQDMAELIQQHDALQVEITKLREDSIARIKAQMEMLGVTLEDLGGRPARKNPTPSGKRPVKYRSPQGDTWTGVGQRPRWLKKALAEGATIEQFSIKAA